jgi:hypothetical protein
MGSASHTSSNPRRAQPLACPSGPTHTPAAGSLAADSLNQPSAILIKHRLRSIPSACSIEAGDQNEQIELRPLPDIPMSAIVDRPVSGVLWTGCEPIEEEVLCRSA